MPQWDWSLTFCIRIFHIKLRQTSGSIEFSSSTDQGLGYPNRSLFGYFMKTVQQRRRSLCSMQSGIGGHASDTTESHLRGFYLRTTSSMPFEVRSPTMRCLCRSNARGPISESGARESETSLRGNHIDLFQALSYSTRPCFQPRDPQRHLHHFGAEDDSDINAWRHVWWLA